MFDLGAYLRRLGFGSAPLSPDGRLDLAALHRAHVVSIPFENLDPRRGAPVLLDSESLQRKLVDQRRGGYCFEQNLLFAAAVQALSAATVEPLLARVRWGRPAAAPKPLTHLLLRITTSDGVVHHADVGFGNGTLLEPIPFGAGGPYLQSGWRFRVVSEEDELVLQSQRFGEWLDVYAFAPRAVQPIDIELSNWYTSTSPESHFVRGLVVSTVGADGDRSSLSDLRGPPVLTLTRPNAEAIETPVPPDQVPRLLRERFGIEPPDTDS